MKHHLKVHEKRKALSNYGGASKYQNESEDESQDECDKKAMSYKIDNILYSKNSSGSSRPLEMKTGDGLFYEISRRLAIIFYIANIYINHIYLIRILKLLKFKKRLRLNVIYLPIFYMIITLTTILIIIGLPWVNPLFKYPDQLKNIIEWNYFLLTLIFYIPLSFLFYQFDSKFK